MEITTENNSSRTSEQVKPGYKKTKVGVIPEDWEVKRLGEIGLPKMCKRIFKEQTTTIGDIPFYKIGTFGGVPDAFITKELFEEYKSKYSFPKKGDILISAAGTIGRLVVYDGIPAYFQDSNIVWIDNNEKLISNKLLFYIYSIVRWQKTEGGIVSRLYNSDLKNVSLPIPPLPEQKAIADCLTTWDKGIEKLTQLIASKKEQKKGLMQQLLTGKKRLDGFTEEWEFKKISKVAKIIGGGTPSTVKNEYWDGDINWFTPTEIKTKFVNESRRKITKSGLKNSSAKILPSGTILLTTRATIGEASIAKIECSTNQGFQSIVCIEGKANVLFFYDLIRYNKKEFLRKANGSTFLEISKKEVEKIKLKIPSIEEQTAIAEVLTTADKEIELLEKKLETFKTQKKGLMQVLLTGTLRLCSGTNG